MAKIDSRHPQYFNFLSDFMSEKYPDLSPDFVHMCIIDEYEPDQIRRKAAYDYDANAKTQALYVQAVNEFRKYLDEVNTDKISVYFLFLASRPHKNHFISWQMFRQIYEIGEDQAALDAFFKEKARMGTRMREAYLDCAKDVRTVAKKLGDIPIK